MDIEILSEGVTSSRYGLVERDYKTGRHVDGSCSQLMRAGEVIRSSTKSTTALKRNINLSNTAILHSKGRLILEVSDLRPSCPLERV